jgi:hypothetical protein
MLRIPFRTISKKKKPLRISFGNIKRKKTLLETRIKLFKDKEPHSDYFFAEFRSVPYILTSEWAITRHTEFSERNTVFRRITKTVLSLYLRIFSDCNLDDAFSTSSIPGSAPQGWLYPLSLQAMRRWREAPANGDG